MYFSPLSSLSEDFVDCRFCLALIVVVLCIMWLLLRTWDGVLHSWRNVSHGVGWSTEKANSVSSYRFTDVAYLIVIYWFIKHVSVSGLCHHSPRKIPIHSCLWLTWSQGFPFAITLFLSDWFILVGLILLKTTEKRCSRLSQDVQSPIPSPLRTVLPWWQWLVAVWSKQRVLPLAYSLRSTVRESTFEW